MISKVVKPHVATSRGVSQFVLNSDVLTAVAKRPPKND